MPNLNAERLPHRDADREAVQPSQVVRRGQDARQLVNGGHGSAQAL